MTAPENCGVYHAGDPVEQSHGAFLQHNAASHRTRGEVEYTWGMREGQEDMNEGGFKNIAKQTQGSSQVKSSQIKRCTFVLRRGYYLSR